MADFLDLGGLERFLGKIKSTFALKADTYTKSEVDTLTSEIGTVTYIQDKTASTDTSFILAPNYKYLFGEKTLLTITLGVITDHTIVNHYMFEFTSGSTATTLSLPASIKWTTEPSIKPNKIYLVSIENNLGVIQEWT